MALDKQRILSELGSVVNQLQSADCGCMGKLFSNPGQTDNNMRSSLPTCGGCRRNCCHGHGYSSNYNSPCGAPSAGEPYPSMNTNMNRPCVSFCNPPKLYADTYGYLNQNLMQPVVKEVYDDLKSISPENTIMNTPMANMTGMSNQSQMGQNNGGNPMQQNQIARGDIAGTMPSLNYTGMPLQNTNGSYPNQQYTGQTGGMGPNIVNMIMGNSGQKPNVGPSQAQGDPMKNLSNNIPSQEYHNESRMPGSNGLQTQNPVRQFSVPNQNVVSGDAQVAQYQPPNSINPTYANPNANPNQQLAQTNPLQNMAAGQREPSYGLHSQGVSKFKEMFPGVMQGLGGDLGFDPMAIAIQMNPANQQKAAMDNIQKLMGGTCNNKTFNTNHTAPALGEGVQRANNHVPMQSPPEYQIQPNQQQPVPNSDVIPTQQLTRAVPSQQQQIYTAVPSMINQPQSQNQQPQVHDPNMPVNMMQQDNAQLKDSMVAQQLPIKEPIFPADTSKNSSLPHPLYTTQRPYEYNTLGQPVEMLPAKTFRNPVPNLPQTLSPQDTPSRIRQAAYSNVKPTVSKTSIVGNKPFGKTPSRSQLQHIYNQYKGSQSYTQQNFNQPAHGATHSDGKLNIAQKNYNQMAPVERVGDSASNKMVNDQTMNKVEQVTGNIGDGPAVKPGGDGGIPDTIPLSNNSKCRNGLQDMVYTSYPSSTAWSFHGDRMPYPTGYRFRT